jgi:hypothetical protein
LAFPCKNHSTCHLYSISLFYDRKEKTLKIDIVPRKKFPQTVNAKAQDKPSSYPVHNKIPPNTKYTSSYPVHNKIPPNPQCQGTAVTQLLSRTQSNPPTISITPGPNKHTTKTPPNPQCQGTEITQLLSSTQRNPPRCSTPRHSNTPIPIQNTTESSKTLNTKAQKLSSSYPEHNRIPQNPQYQGTAIPWFLSSTQHNSPKLSIPRHSNTPAPIQYTTKSPQTLNAKAEQYPNSYPVHNKIPPLTQYNGTEITQLLSSTQQNPLKPAIPRQSNTPAPIQ